MMLSAFKFTLAERAEALFQEHADSIRRQTDKLFVVLLICQYAAGILLALVLSPREFDGTESRLHLHVWAAVGLGGLIAALPIALVIMKPGCTLTRHVIAAG